ncbi:MAG: DUF1549 and DUF1553 domain-containing protein [Planctomycetota bacterium]|nr:DUF1549 and DUF1553 domain-containing protein [Planctomycetota bacterium]
MRTLPTQPIPYIALVCGLLMSQFVPARGAEDPPASAAHWSFQPIRAPHRDWPQPTGFVSSPIDQFLLAKLQREQVVPSPVAAAAILIKRLHLDLVGLLPTPDESQRFSISVAPDRASRVVDRLLASPAYGERWARPWLDLCHYADSDGYLTDQRRPVAWRYRDWLVDALNQDLPFDQFTIRQLAGDLLPDATQDQKLATGFLRQTLSNREGGADLEEFRVLQVVDRTEMVSTIWLGMTIGCARCHDHKYDPVSQREFYQLYAFLDGADEVNIDAPLPQERATYQRTYPQYAKKRQARITPQQTALYGLMRKWELRLLQAMRHPGEDAHWDRQWELLGLIWGGGLGEGQLEGTQIAQLEPAQRTFRQQQDLLDYFLGHTGGIDPAAASQLKLDSLRGDLNQLKQDFLRATRAPTMRATQVPRSSYLHVAGDFRDRGPTVFPATPQCLTVGEGALEPVRSMGKPRRDRLQLARWLVDHKNPLPARVTVNRAWQQFFGNGLVLTTEDFGVQGERPSHPSLLDWLAREFMRREWSFKQLHRQIVSSDAYQRSSHPRPELVTRDPENRWLARQNALRVPAETVRDITLTASGQLTFVVGGPSVFPPQPERVIKEAFGNHPWQVSTGANRHRRSLYTFVQRTAPFAQSTIFDAPNPNETCTRRERSNTPLQALVLLNDATFLDAAKALAQRIVESTTEEFSGRLRFAYSICLARRPTVPEQERLATYLKEFRSQLRNDPQAVDQLTDTMVLKETAALDAASWVGLASVLLNLHEFITRE